MAGVESLRPLLVLRRREAEGLYGRSARQVPFLFSPSFVGLPEGSKGVIAGGWIMGNADRRLDTKVVGCWDRRMESLWVEVKFGVSLKVSWVDRFG